MKDPVLLTLLGSEAAGIVPATGALSNGWCESSGSIGSDERWRLLQIYGINRFCRKDAFYLFQPDLNCTAAGGGFQVQFGLSPHSQQQFWVGYQQKCEDVMFQRSMICWLMVKITATHRKTFWDILFRCSALRYERYGGSADCWTHVKL
jgi:hypothetical protein